MSIYIVCLPPHTSSTLQPLDVGVYGPAKKSLVSNFAKVVREVKATNSVKASISNSSEGALQRNFCKET